jgi:hypothetical protein
LNWRAFLAAGGAAEAVVLAKSAVFAPVTSGSGPWAS